jgi:hypothetical protein
MANNTTGNHNIAMGYYSLGFNTNGSYNLALGNTALYNNTTGSLNTGVGAFSLFQNRDGIENIGIGYRSLYSLSGGDNNIAIGNNAGENCIVSSNNVLISNLGLSGDTNTIRIGNDNTNVAYIPPPIIRMGAVTVIGSPGTITPAAIKGGIIYISGGNYTLQTPSGSAISSIMGDRLVSGNIFDFSIACSGWTATLANSLNTGVNLLGNNIINSTTRKISMYYDGVNWNLY